MRKRTPERKRGKERKGEKDRERVCVCLSVCVCVCVYERQRDVLVNSRALGFRGCFCALVTIYTCGCVHL